MFEQKLEKYADLVVRVGLNVQPGQRVQITVPIELATFGRLLVSKAYEAGAKDVYVNWADEQVTRLRYLLAPEESLHDVASWTVQQYTELSQTNGAFLTVYVEDPELLKDCNPERIAISQKARRNALKIYRDQTSSMRVSWLLISAPSTAWAAKVFPDLSPEAAVDRMWDYIFKTNRIELDDPVAAWKEHIAHLKARADWLNQSRFRRLRYQAPGTDLTIELPEGHIWISAESTNDEGTVFVPNMPTEEVFTMPAKDGVNGTLSSTMPLCYNGVLIKDMKFHFEKGRIVDFSASEGYDTLKTLMETDEGSKYLGEIALVPHDSPISNLHTLFYNTLFDENASCHVAIGNAYPVCIEGGMDMDTEELARHRVNQSLSHEDFMVGSGELEIDGETADGQWVPVFRKGNWATSL